MRIPLPFLLQERKVQGLEEGYESWKKDHAEAMLAYDVQDLVEECLGLAAATERAWDRTRDRLHECRSDDLDQLGAFIGQLLERVCRLLEGVNKDVREFVQVTGHQVGGLDTLSLGAGRLRDLRTRILANWPWDDSPWPPLNRAMQQRARSGQDGPGEDVAILLQRVKAGEPLT